MGEIRFILALGFALMAAINFLRIWSTLRQHKEHMQRHRQLIHEIVGIQILLARRERDRAGMEAIEAQNRLNPRSQD